jgi:hypothetical protein
MYPAVLLCRIMAGMEAAHVGPGVHVVADMGTASRCEGLGFIGLIGNCEVTMRICI